MEQYNAALKLIKLLNDKGYLAYIVGGYVRDKALNIASNDIDITTNALPENLEKDFNLKKTTAGKYLSCVVLFEGFEFELTTFRYDIEYTDHRHPITAVANNLEDDLRRRDFTIDALVLDSEERIIDLFGGLDDLNHMRIRTIGNPYKRFDEDALRILRACYLASKLNFEIEDETIKGMQASSKYLPLLSTERIFNEIEKLLMYANYLKGLLYLKKSFASRYLGFDKTIDLLFNSDLKPTLDDMIIISMYYNENVEFKLSKAKETLYKKALELLNMNLIDNMILYRYRLEEILLANRLKKYLHKDFFDEEIILKKYNILPIKSRKDINIDSQELMNLFNKPQGYWIKETLDEIENKILTQNLKNDKNEILKFIKEEKHV